MPAAPRPATSSLGPAPGRLLVGAAIILLAANLRVAVTSIGVVLDSLQSDLGLSAAGAGILTTLPVLCFAVFGAGSHGVVRRIGLHRTAAALLVVTATGLVLRAVVDSAVLFLLLSVVALAGSAVGNVILPALAKTHFPDRLPLVSALYGAALMTGATLGSIVTVPVADAFGGWRTGIGAWAVLALLTLAPWLRMVARDVHVDPVGGTSLTVRDLARSRLAWAVMLCFGVQSAQAYAQFGWLPEILRDGGVSRAESAAMLGVVTAIGIPVTLALPPLIRAAGSRPLLPWGFALLTSAGWTGVLVAPDHVTWMWALMLGVGGCAFTWTLTMIGRRTRTPDGTAALSAFGQGLGYLIAAFGPLGTGLLHDATGSWTAPVSVLLAAGLLIGVFGQLVNRDVQLEDTLA